MFFLARGCNLVVILSQSAQDLPVHESLIELAFGRMKELFSTRNTTNSVAKFASQLEMVNVHPGGSHWVPWVYISMELISHLTFLLPLPSGEDIGRHGCSYLRIQGVFIGYVAVG